MLIRSKSELRIAYETIDLVKKVMGMEGCDIERAKDLLKEKKREIRQYYKRQDAEAMHIVKDYGMDGYIELFQFPDCVKDEMSAKEYFEDNYRMVCIPSAYDCTGQAFTGWYKVFERNGKLMCFHRVEYDF